MEAIAVISPVYKPTQWCASMLVVMKPTGGVRIRVNFTGLHHYVLQEWHLIPTVYHTLGLLHNAKVFSKLDANSRLWQIPQTETAGSSPPSSHRLEGFPSTEYHSAVRRHKQNDILCLVANSRGICKSHD